MDARDWSLPCFRFIHSFFKSKARAKKKSSVQMLAFPRVKKRRKPKSFLSRANAPSTWMERQRRRWIPRSVIMFPAASSRFSQKFFLRMISLGLSGTLARQHCVRCGHPPQSSHRYQAVDTNCPSCTSVVSRLRCSFLPCTQVKQSSSGSYSMFSMRPTCLRNLLVFFWS